jgi:hypothetical protein
MPRQTIESMPLTLAGGTLLATQDDRTFQSRLVPFGEVATSNLGRFEVGPGVLQLPADPTRTMVWNDGHDRERPVGVTTLLAERADGIWASVRIADGPEGDAMVGDIRAGRRNRVSVEAADMVIDAGRAIAGRVFGAAIVSEGRQGAFPSATLLAMAPDTLLADDAADIADPTDPTQAHYTTMNIDPVTGETFETETTVEETTETDPETGAQVVTRTTTDTTTITPGTPAESDPNVTAQPAATAPAAAPLLAQRRPGTVVPAGILAGRRTSERTPAAPRTVDRRTLYAMLAAAAPRGRGQAWNADIVAKLLEPRVVGSLYAELSDVTFDAAGSPNDMIVPQWIGELWSGRAFQRRWAPLFNQGTLTSDSVKGWRWVSKPEVDLYEGNKTDVPSNEFETESYDEPAQPIAGAHDVDRRYRDFNVTDFWDGYFTAMTESYARKSDAYVATRLFAAGNTTSVAGGVVPTGVSPVMAKIVDGALAVLDEDLPSFAVVTRADFRDLALTREQDNLAFLNTSLGLEEGAIESFRIVPAAAGTTALETGNKTLVGCRSAATVHELAGSPIRVEGLDMSKGGIDPGLFGYIALATHNPAALAVVSPHA